MPRFFIRANQIEDGVVTLLGDDAHHISRSLRMAAGETVTVCDMQKNEYECQLTDFLPDRVLAKILETRKCDTEPPYYAHLYQALPKGDKLDSVIQKAVECGASEITTFESERCIVRAKGILPVGLGKRILRTETASGFALACLVYALEMK